MVVAVDQDRDLANAAVHDFIDTLQGMVIIY